MAQREQLQISFGKDASQLASPKSGYARKQNYPTIEQTTKLLTKFRNILNRNFKFKERNEWTEAYKRQILLEGEQHSAAVEDTLESLTAHISRNKSTTSLQNIQTILNPWASTLTTHLSDAFINSDLFQFDDILAMVKVERIAQITLTTTFNNILKTGNRGAKVTELAMIIADKLVSQYNKLYVKQKQGANIVSRWMKFRSDNEKFPVAINWNEVERVSCISHF